MRKVTLGEVAREHKEVCREDRSSYPIVGLEHLTPEDVNLTAWSEDAENRRHECAHREGPQAYNHQNPRKRYHP